jgi:hypothetical protein
LTATRTKTPILGSTPTMTPTPTNPSGFSKLYPGITLSTLIRKASHSHGGLTPARKNIVIAWT